MFTSTVVISVLCSQISLFDAELLVRWRYLAISSINYHTSVKRDYDIDEEDDFGYIMTEALLRSYS